LLTTHKVKPYRVRMHNNATSYDVARLRRDIVEAGWLPIDLARRAKVSHMTVSRFLSGERQTPRTAKKLAAALGFSIRRYIVSSEAVA